jgi:integrase
VTEAGRQCERDAGAPYLVATFLLTGGRKSEVFGLDVEDVSFDRGLVYFLAPHGGMVGDLRKSLDAMAKLCGMEEGEVCTQRHTRGLPGGRGARVPASSRSRLIAALSRRVNPVHLAV